MKVPKGFSGVANGAFVGKKELEDGHDQYEFKLDFPCPSYLICIAVGDLVIVEDSPADKLVLPDDFQRTVSLHPKKKQKRRCETDPKKKKKKLKVKEDDIKWEEGVIPLRYISVKGTEEENLRLSFGETKGMMKWLQSKLLVPMPWPKYDQIFHPEIDGAMENISFVTWNQMYMVDRNLQKEFRNQLLHQVILHEMAHTYFGDAVVIRHFEHAWLKESWATFMESLWLLENRSKDHYFLDLYDNAVNYIAESDGEYARPIVTRSYDHSWSMFDHHLYPGGAWRLHMLQHLLGDECFWRGVRRYLYDFFGKTAETDHFRSCLERESGINLVPFFDQWFYRPGYPVIRLSYTYSAPHQSLAVSLHQIQAAAAAPPSSSGALHLFDIDVEVLVSFKDANGEIKTVTEVVEMRANKDNNVAFSKTFAGVESSPLTVVVDPESKLLFKLQFDDKTVGNDVLFRVARFEANPIVRLRALDHLIQNNNCNHSVMVHHLDAIIKDEPFFGTRRKIAEILASKHSLLATQLLLNMLQRETHDMVFESIFQSLISSASYSSTSSLSSAVIQETLKFLEARPDLNRASASALRVLGAHCKFSLDLAVFNKIMSIAQRPSNRTDMDLHGTVKSAAIEALGTLLPNVASSFYQGDSATSEEKAKIISDVIGLLEDLSRLESDSYPPTFVRITGVPSALRSIVASSMTPRDLKERMVRLLVALLQDPHHKVKAAAFCALSSAKVSEAVPFLNSAKRASIEQYHPALERQIEAVTAPSAVSDQVLIKDLQKQIEALSSIVKNLTTSNASSSSSSSS